MEYIPRGVCSRLIKVDVDDNKIQNVEFVGGWIFTIEPMINEGSPDFFIDEENDWTVYTIDDGLSAQVEYMVLITEDGAEVLTK